MKGLFKKKVKNEDTKKEEVATPDTSVPGIEVIAGFPVQLVDQTNLVIDDKNIPGCAAMFQSGLITASEWEQLVVLIQEGAEARVVVERVVVPEPSKPPKPAE